MLSFLSFKCDLLLVLEGIVSVSCLLPYLCCDFPALI